MIQNRGSTGEDGVRRKSVIVLGFSVLAAAAVAAAAGGGQAASAAGPPKGSPPGLDKAVAALNKHRDRLLDKPGVVGVAVVLNKAGKAVVRVYKQKDDVADVPSSVDGVEVESVTTGMIEPRAPTDRFPRPVPIGVSSGVVGFATGTLGARVTDGTKIFALSNNHVFAASNNANIGDAILQPGAGDGGSDPADRIGTLYAFQPINFTAGSTNTMDAAIALSSAANVGTSTPPDGYGTPSAITAAAYIGQPVQKYGRTTGLQSGVVAGLDVAVDVCYLPLLNFCLQEARFVNQISITPGAFSGPGDSGSLIVSQDGNQPVALLFAGGDGLTIGTPIDVVLQRFGVTIDGSVPTNGPPSAPTGLAAVAGDAQVSLSWTAPSFDGGSAVSNYRVYRGTSPNGETFLANAGTATSFTDGGAANDTTYYYKVSAENGNGEGALSGEASASPAVVVNPAEPLSVLDGFNRANESPLSGGAKWSNGVNGSNETGSQVVSNALACSKSTSCASWWNVAPYGPDTEVWGTVTTLPGAGNQLRLYARIQQPGSLAVDAYMLRTNQLAGIDEVYLERVDNSAFVRLLTVGQELAVGDTLLLRASGSRLEAWLKHGSAWSRLGGVTDTTYPAAGFVGAGVRGTTGRLDDFGARGLGDAADTVPPSAPGSLQASAVSETRVDLSWSAATDNVGVARYRVERCQGAGCSSFAEIGTTTGTSYSDTGLTESTGYSYRVRAEDAVPNAGPFSNVASATTLSSAVSPAEPLSTLDGFNRANESPLSGGAKWSNGVNGSNETGMILTSNAMACSKSTSCASWWNVRSHGPDTEVWSTITALPGTGNGFRVYARIQQPGSLAVDAYMLRTNQLSGADEVYLERVDDSTFVRLLTRNQELAVGDTLLLRVTGSRLEAWLRRGSTWTLVGGVTDTTYPAAGFVAAGMRGTAGRLDDFGVRGVGSSADTDPPSAPGSLQAGPMSQSRVDLSWSAATDNVGVSQYRVERCQGAGCSSFTEITTTTATSYSDTGLSAATDYSYRVRAEDSVPNLGPYSNVASATTQSSAVNPAEPLPILDSFDRPNESNLSGGGKWSNGVNGSNEVGSRVIANALACSKSTSCASWWNVAPYGPNTEVWGTVTVLPGTGNQFRLYARIQAPGSLAVDAYMLRTNQLAGTDEVYLERVDDSTFVRLLTVGQELAVGDTLLLRVTGSRLEAWLRRGSAWTLLGSATDTTYPSSGFTGAGVRGTTGRLDDFGAR